MRPITKFAEISESEHKQWTAFDKLPDDIQDACEDCITLDKVQEPVLLSSGHTISKAQCEQLIEAKQNNPVTRDPLHANEVFPNNALQRFIEKPFAGIIDPITQQAIVTPVFYVGCGETFDISTPINAIKAQYPALDVSPANRRDNYKLKKVIIAINKHITDKMSKDAPEGKVANANNSSTMSQQEIREKEEKADRLFAANRTYEARMLLVSIAQSYKKDVANAASAGSLAVIYHKLAQLFDSLSDFVQANKYYREALRYNPPPIAQARIYYTLANKHRILISGAQAALHAAAAQAAAQQGLVIARANCVPGDAQWQLVIADLYEELFYGAKAAFKKGCPGATKQASKDAMQEYQVFCQTLLSQPASNSMSSSSVSQSSGVAQAQEEKVKESLPNCIRHFILGRMHLANKSPQESLLAMEQAYKCMPKNLGETDPQLAITILKQYAIALCEQVLVGSNGQKIPKNTSLAEYLQQVGRINELATHYDSHTLALQVMQQAHLIGPVGYQYRSVYNQLSRIGLRLGNFEQAIQLKQKSLAKSPNDIPTILDLAELRFKHAILNCSSPNEKMDYLEFAENALYQLEVLRLQVSEKDIARSLKIAMKIFAERDKLQSQQSAVMSVSQADQKLSQSDAQLSTLQQKLTAYFDACHQSGLSTFTSGKYALAQDATYYIQVLLCADSLPSSFHEASLNAKLQVARSLIKYWQMLQQFNGKDFLPSCLYLLRKVFDLNRGVFFQHFSMQKLLGLLDVDVSAFLDTSIQEPQFAPFFCEDRSMQNAGVMSFKVNAYLDLCKQPGQRDISLEQHVSNIEAVISDVQKSKEEKSGNNTFKLLEADLKQMFLGNKFFPKASDFFIALRDLERKFPASTGVKNLLTMMRNIEDVLYIAGTLGIRVLLQPDDYSASYASGAYGAGM